MKQNDVQRPAGSSQPRFDFIAAATLVGVVMMLTITVWNLVNLNRLGQRVVSLETALRGGTSQPAAVEGPDPNKIHTVAIASAPATGPASAPITIVEFSDFQCPFCARVRLTLKQIEERYGSNVRIVWKHLPLPIHPDAVAASLAAEAAENQGKFWEYHDSLFANQDKLGTDGLKQFARDLQLDISRFERDMQDPEKKKKIDSDIAEAQTLGITATPGIFINGRFILGAQPFEKFAKIIDEELNKLDLPVPSKASSE